MFRIWAGVFVGLAILAVSQPSFAEKRIALVIGNGAYGSIGALRNPPNDARLMARTLRQIGFDVIERIDTTQKGMKKAIKAFGNKLETAGKDAVGLFYYAGHGVQVNGTNYLVPVNVEIQDEADVDIEAVSANGIQGQMAYAGNRLNIIIMDACRNNPFKRGFRSATRGLAKMDATKGTLIAYATSPGDVAADGSGANSPYTEALSKALLTPGLTVERMFKEVRNQVVAATDSGQVPWESSSLTGADFYFSGGETPFQASAAVTPPTSMVPAPPRVDRAALELAFWESVKNSSNPAMFREYLKEYPDGQFAGLARIKLETFERESRAALKPPEPIVIRAGDFQRSHNVEVGVLPYGAGVVHNAAPYWPQQNVVEYDFVAVKPGTYRLLIEYAAESSRPVVISLNDEVVNRNGLASTTGGWESIYQKWISQGVVRLGNGPNTLRLSRDNYFPHIRAIKFVPTDKVGQSVGPCEKIVGEWAYDWTYGVSDVTVSRNGTAYSRYWMGDVSGRWECADRKNGTFVFRWDHGYVGTVHMLPNGNELKGRNNAGWGLHLVRKGSPEAAAKQRAQDAISETEEIQ